MNTKQTRNPPLEVPTKTMETSTTWRKRTTSERNQVYYSPTYVKDREGTSKSSQRRRDIFPQRTSGQWRPKQTKELLATPNEATNYHETTAGTNNLNANMQQELRADQTPSMEAVMEELQEVTRQYLNCHDPVEARARKQCVLQGDANGLMEKTSARIIAAVSQKHEGFVLERREDNNPNTPPPLQVDLVQPLPSSELSALLSPHDGFAEETNTGIDRVQRGLANKRTNIS